MRAFEIHTFRDGVWRVDSVFDDQELALYEAKRVETSRRYPGVKVVEEIFDEASNLTKTRTLYRGGSAKSPKADPAERAGKSKQRGGARGGTGKVPLRNGRRKQKKKSSILVPFLLLLILVMAGLIGLLGLNYLSQLK